MSIEILDTHGVLQLGASEFLFDVEDLSLVQSREWYRDKDGYLVSCYFFCGRRCFTRFHRIVMHAQPNQFVDHINRNRADNRKQNLRCCDRSENMRNRSLQRTNTSGVAGVYFDKERNKWTASITKEDAILARLSKEAELFKDFAPQRELMKELTYGQCNYNIQR